MRLISASLTILLAIVGSSAQTKAPDAARDIPPEKQALIRELYAVTKLSEMAEKITDTFLDKLGADLPATLHGALRDSLNPKGRDREELERAIAESSHRVYNRLRELLPQRLNWGETMEQIFSPIYDKHFNEQELRDLIVFYKSPTGQKAIQVMPDLFKEGLEKASEVLNPKLIKLMNEVLDEEKERLRKM